MQNAVRHWATLIAFCAPGTWLTLWVRFHGQGRLLGSARSMGAALFVVLCSCVLGPGAALLTTNASRLPAPAVSAATGIGIVSPVRSRRQGKVDGAGRLQDVVTPVLLRKLVAQMTDDRVAWCEEVAAGFTDGWELISFLDKLHAFLLKRAGAGLPPGSGGESEEQVSAAEKRRYKAQAERINATYEHAIGAARNWISRQNDLEKKEREGSTHEIAEAKAARNNAHGQAESMCCELLATAYYDGVPPSGVADLGWGVRGLAPGVRP